MIRAKVPSRRNAPNWCAALCQTQVVHQLVRFERVPRTLANAGSRRLLAGVNVSPRESSYHPPTLQYLVADCSKQISRVPSLGSGTWRYV
jgi:hypothetical protein